MDQIPNGAVNQEDEFGEQQITAVDQWTIINAYFEQNGVVNQQIQSFNRFTSTMIADCVKEHQHNVIKIDRQFAPGTNERIQENICYQVKFGKVYVQKMPKLYDPKGGKKGKGEYYSVFPHEARIRNLTYKIESLVDVHVEKRHYSEERIIGEVIETYEKKRIKLCDVPLMVRS